MHSVEKDLRREREKKSRDTLFTLHAVTNVSMWRLGIVSNFDGLEAYWPLHPETACTRRTGMAEDLPLLILYDLRLPGS